MPLFFVPTFFYTVPIMPKNKMTTTRRGRPKLKAGEGADQCLPNVRLPGALLSGCRQASVVSGKTLSEWVRDALRDALKEQGVDGEYDHLLDLK